MRRWFPARRAWIEFAALALTANLVWEVTQMPLYDVEFRFLRCVRAAFGDVLIILVVAALALVATRRRPRWFLPAIAVALLIIGGVVEAASLAAGRWSYDDAMPTVVGIGLTPLVQLALLGVLAARATLHRGTRPHAPRAAVGH